MVVEVEGGGGPEAFVPDVQLMAAYFYGDDGLLASTWSARLKRAFEVPTEMFYRVLMYTKVGKTVSIICKPCHTIGGHSDKSYGLRMTGGGGGGG